MMEVYRTRIDTIRNYNLDPNEVIAGLNGYYESDKRNAYITVMRNDFEGPAYFTAALYLSALIEWLREDHDIFYRPGLIFDQVEAARSAAKMCGLRAHIKDEISKRGLWCGADEDVPELVDTLFKVIDECGECADKNRKDTVKLSEEIRCVVKEKESAIKNLKERIAELESNFKAVCDERDLFKTWALKAEEEVRKLKVELNAVKDTVSQVRARLNSKFISRPGYEEDLVKLADIAGKAVDARDETIELRAKTRAEIENYKLKLKDYILKDIKEHGYRYDGLETKSIEEIVDWIITMATCPRDELAASEIRNLRGHIDRLKGLINAMNKGVGDM